MEKLIELLNEYDEIREYVEVDLEDELISLRIISKWYGFIKRLVDNDKIDYEKVENKFYNEICITDYGDKDRAYGKSDLVISVLSISDEPISDLISYLK